ncbi:MAG: hypothetical protein RBT75_08190 [Anaerolineae bacterium]|jgi:hypothetical protein|nr:hypothetical protein [Anaerolineae bacterium]
MTPQAVYEIVGYVASVLIAISLMMSSLLKLRLTNLIGAIVFTVYGLLIKAYPIAAVNGFIVIVDIYYLYQMLRAKEYFSLLEVMKGSRFLHTFLNFHREEIHRFFPNFVYEASDAHLAFFVLRDMVPAGLFIAEPTGPQSAHILLDFVAPGYRDLRVAQFVFVENAHIFREKGIHRFTAEAATPKHARYLERIGFHPESSTEDGQTRYVLTIA